MSETQFRIVTNGQIAAGFSRETVEANLAQLCKFGPAKLALVFAGNSFVFKADLDSAAAKRYLGALSRCGIVCKAQRMPTQETPGVETGRIEMADSSPSIAMQGEDADQVTCPKCGSVQAQAISCHQCQVVMARYRSPQTQQQSQQTVDYPPEYYSEPQTKRVIHVDKIIMMVLAVIGFCAWMIIAKPYISTAGDLDTDAGIYTNEHFKFALAFPAEWNNYTVEESIHCATIQSQYADQYLLQISPYNEAHSLMVVNIAGTSLETFKKIGWDGMVKSNARRNKTLYQSVDEVGGLTVYRVGYNIAQSYREDLYFDANGTLMQIYFFVKKAAPDHDAWVLEMRGVLEENLRAI